MEIKKGYWFKYIGQTYQRHTSGKVYFALDGMIENDYKRQEFITDRNLKKSFQKLYTIQDLKDGKVAVINDGTFNELQSIVELKYPCEAIHEYMNIKTLYKDNKKNKYWVIGNNGLPTQSVKDFLVQLPKEDPDLKQIRNFNFPPITEQEAKEAIEAIMSPINPKHYSFTIKGTPCDLFDIGNAMDLNKEQFTALRYFRKKENQIEDTKKAIKCLERLVERLEAEKND